jgi:Zn-dependent metalloprotease
MKLSCRCFIIPPSVLRRFAEDPSLTEATREAFQQTVKLEPAWRKLRTAHNVATRAKLTLSGSISALAAAPAVTVYTCKGTISEPGTPITNPGGSTDSSAKRAFEETTGVAKFYQTCFGRNSVDNSGMTLLSSIHYDKRYNNAFWNGSQMTYGDGDGQIFVDFTMSNDVIGHELTHGVTQYTAGLGYADEPGALNESISDVFGSMFRQWEADQTVVAADWLIGSGIMGPAAKQKGYTCLRDMANPGAKHCLSPQPVDYTHYVPRGDPHVNSGIPNRAFCLIAKSIGGKSWEKAGKVWYAALTSKKATKSMSFRTFAGLTQAAAKTDFRSEPAVLAAVTSGWKAVGVL